MLYGLNQGKLVAEQAIPPAAARIAEANDFDLTLNKFGAASEARDPRVTRFGVTQNSIILPTTASVDAQYQSLQDRHEKFIEAAAAAGTNVLCFQEVRLRRDGCDISARSA